MFATAERLDLAAFTRPIWSLRDRIFLPARQAGNVEGYRSFAGTGLSLAVLRDQVHAANAVRLGLPRGQLIVFDEYDVRSQPCSTGAPGATHVSPSPTVSTSPPIRPSATSLSSLCLIRRFRQHPALSHVPRPSPRRPQHRTRRPARRRNGRRTFTQPHYLAELIAETKYAYRDTQAAQQCGGAG